MLQAAGGTTKCCLWSTVSLQYLNMLICFQVSSFNGGGFEIKIVIVEFSVVSTGENTSYQILLTRLTWDSYVGLLGGTLTWESYVGILCETITLESYVGLLGGNLTWNSHRSYCVLKFRIS